MPVTKPWLQHYEKSVPHRIDYPDISLCQLLEHSAQKHPGSIATVFFGAKLTYRQLDDAVNAFSAALASLGIKKGDRVALLLPNCPQVLIAYYGTLKAGAIVVPTNPLYVESELQHQFNDAEVQTVVTLTRFYPLVKRVQPKTAIRNIIVANIKDYFPPALRFLFTLAKEKKEGDRVEIDRGHGNYRFLDLLRQHTGQVYQAPVSSGDVALLQYTGGTTGTAKGAMLTHRNLVANTMQAASWLTDVKEAGEVFLCVIPFFHVYGMTTAMNLGVYLAGTLVMLPRFQLDEVLKTINKYRPTIFPGVPTMYVAINNNPQIGKYHVKSIRACLSGAAPLPVEVQQRFETLTGGRLVEGYGLTEASPVLHANPIYGLRKAGSIGLPVPDVEAKIVDVETGLSELGIGEIGEIVVRGPQVMKGYWNQPVETANVVRDGWLYTGDIGKMDEDGFFYIVDRKKDIVIAGGYNIYPRDVEETLYSHPKIREAVVAGIPDQYRGETLKAYVVLREGCSATEQEIIDFCRDKMARYKVPTAVEFRAELPKTLVGKFLRRVLVEEEKRKLGTT
ncbi:MAG: long-chain fatty acid--CoA ligase [Chloroflexi bacterium]|nr:long-chain fatty acid--CoA ligase [Chloroflexota bacterium]